MCFSKVATLWQQPQHASGTHTVLLLSPRSVTSGTHSLSDHDLLHSVSHTHSSSHPARLIPSRLPPHFRPISTRGATHRSENLGFPTYFCAQRPRWHLRCGAIACVGSVCGPMRGVVSATCATANVAAQVVQRVFLSCKCHESVVAPMYVGPLEGEPLGPHVNGRSDDQKRFHVMNRMHNVSWQALKAGVVGASMPRGACVLRMCVVHVRRIGIDD